MGDPLSITAGVIAVLGAARKVSQGLGLLKAAKDAPEGLENLLSRVSSIESVLEAIKKTSMDPENLSPGMLKVLDMTKNKFTEMEALLEYSLTQAGTSSKVDRWQWMRKHGEAGKLLNQLDELRTDLIAHVGIQTSVDVQEVSVYTRDSREFWTRQQQFNERTTSQLAQSDRQLARLKAVIALMCNKIEASPATQADLNRGLGGFREMSISSASDTVALSSDQTADQTAMTIPHDAEERPRPLSRSEFRIQTFRKLQSCSRACPCTCHHFRQIHPPSSTVGLFGRGSLSLKGPLFWKQSCNIRSCKQESGLSITIKYFLPTWLSQRMIYGWLNSTPLCGPELLLRTFQVVDPFEDPLFRAVRYGTLEKVETLLAKGTVSPYIVNRHGESLLHVAFPLQHVAAIPRRGVAAISKLLLGIGLDSKQTDNRGCSPLHQWLVYIRRSMFNGVHAKEWFEFIHALEMEDLDYHCDQLGFSDLHKIVLNMSREDLYTKVQANRGLLDSVDIDGFTALSYACCFGQWQHIRILLDGGADVSSRPRELFWIAVGSRNYQCVKLLIDCGLGPYPWTTSDLLDGEKDLVARAALASYAHYITGWSFMKPDLEENTKAIDEVMILHGFDFNVANFHNKTALMYCSMFYAFRSTCRMRLLLERGVDTGAVDPSNGYTALHYAVYSERVGCFNMLFQYGARLAARTSHGDTILHLAVSRSGRFRFVRGLSEVDLSDVDLDARNDDGNTAFNLLQERAQQRLRWDGWCFPLLVNDTCCFVYSVQDHVAIIRAFEALFHQLQESKGIPPGERYPPLEITLGYGDDADANDENPTEEPAIAVPGSWPEQTPHSPSTHKPATYWPRRYDAMIRYYRLHRYVFDGHH